METQRIALDLAAGHALILARKAGLCKFGLCRLSLAGLLEASPDHNQELLERAFWALCLEGRWPGSQGPR